MKSKYVHVIPHTHWDREWYFTSSRSTIYLVDQVKEVIEKLEGDSEFGFYFLDAQSSLIEDYLTFYPEDRARIQKLISEKRLLIGPWHTQTDQIVISQESIVRNLYYGIDYADSLGHSVKIGYCPDIFGQGGNMPQIYKQFDIQSVIFWRGIGRDRLEKTEAKWIGSDGTDILAIQMPFGYFYGANIPSSEESLSRFIDKMIQPLENKSQATHYYFPNGFDQLPINQDLVPLVDKLNQLDSEREYTISSPERYIESLKNEIQDFELPIIRGELLDGQHTRVHKSINSSRSDLKQLNNQIEMYITNIAEPMATMGYLLGKRYPHKEFEKIWKLLFENAAHDSIGNCNSDETNQDIAARYKLAKELAENIVEKQMRDISSRIKQDELYSFTVFNTLPYERSGLVEAQIYLPDGNYIFIDENGQEIPYEIISKEDQSDYVLHQAELLTPSMFRESDDQSKLPQKVYYSKVHLWIKDMPAFGYQQFYLKPTQSSAAKQESTNSETIENQHFEITFEPKRRTFSIIDKRTNSQYENQFELVENGDDGDSYNYSPPIHDMLISSKDAEVLEINTETSAVEERLNVKLKFSIPKNLFSRAEGVLDEIMLAELTVRLVKGDPLIHFHLEVDNHAMSHRLCVKCATGIISSCSIADQLFGTISRPFVHEKMATWREEGWVEAPISINPMQSYVALSNNKATGVLFTKGVREYEIVGHNYSSIQLTLFRSFSYMGKEELLYRPGRASGESIVTTPDAELLKHMKFDIALYYENKPFDELEVAKLSKLYMSPLQVYELTAFLNSRVRFIRNMPATQDLPIKLSCFEIRDQNIAISAIKKSEHDESIILRVYNPFNKENIILNKEFRFFEAVGLNEKTIVDAKNHLNVCEFMTYKINTADMDLIARINS